jgi:dTDP-glucose 4,6-dehydratase
MRTLITGAAGFLGSHLCDAMLSEGHSVVGIGNFSTGSLDNLRHLRSEPCFELIEGDVSRVFDCGHVDYVFHFASPASPEAYTRLGLETLQVGSSGSFNSLKIAKKYGAKYLLASTSECYGDQLEHPQKETYWGNVNPIGPRSVYDETKRFAEALTMAYRRYKHVDTRIVRIFNTYGPRLHMNDGRLISNFVRQALQEEDLTIYGTGEQSRSFCYVTDEIDGIVRLSRSNANGPMNIGNPSEFTVLECAKLVLRLTGSPSKFRFLPGMEDDPRRRCPDISKATTLLGWRPLVSLEAGLRLSLKYFKDAMVREAAAV